jgi:hypothetical protein
VNARASQLLATIADSLGYWCRVLCEAGGAGSEAALVMCAVTGPWWRTWARSVMWHHAGDPDAAPLAGAAAAQAAEPPGQLDLTAALRPLQEWEGEEWGGGGACNQSCCVFSPASRRPRP